jgi:hypothetical protein
MITADTFARVLVLVGLVVFGTPLCLYVETLLEILFGRILHLHVQYLPPRHYIDKALRTYAPVSSSSSSSSSSSMLSSTSSTAFSTIYTLDVEANNTFFGYYQQRYFQLTPFHRYFRTNVFALFYVCIKILLLAGLGLGYFWVFNIEPTSVFASASVATVLALLQWNDLLKGFVAYIWFIWTNKLKLGDEIEVENNRGFVIEIGPVEVRLHVIARGVPLVGSVGPPESNSTVSLNQKSYALDKNGDGKQDDPHTGAPASISGNSSTSLRHFSIKPGKSENIVVISPPQHTLTPKMQMHQIGYIFLPLQDQFEMRTTTSNLLNTSFRRF